MARTTVVKKKVSAYPFATSMKLESGEAFSGQVVKLAQTGFIAELSPGPIVKVAIKLDFDFELPALHARIAGKGVIVKLYNQLANQPANQPANQAGPAPASAPGAPGSGLRRLAEVRFESVPEDAMNRVRQFLAAIGKSE